MGQYLETFFATRGRQGITVTDWLEGKHSDKHLTMHRIDLSCIRFSDLEMSLVLGLINSV